MTIASVAWACGVLATLRVDKRVAAPGETVTATGSNWGTNATQSPVTIRLSTRDGQVLATTPALPGGKISETFALPTSLSPGWYVLVATQTNANGTPKNGTPGRTTLRVQGNAVAGAAAAPWGSGKPSGPAASAAGAGPSQSLLAILLAGGLSLTMLAGGWKLLSRRSSTVGQPQLGV